MQHKVPAKGSSAAVCDECESARAAVSCDDCGLVYCAPCDAHRHRKGKLQLHTRQALDPPPANAAAAWTTTQVGDWLRAHDLELFLPEAVAHSIDGAMLLSARMEEIVDSSVTASRAYKKKLLREIQKLKDTTSTAAAPASEPLMRTERIGSSSAILAAGSTPFSEPRSSMRRIGMNLRVNVDARPGPALEPQHFSPVTSLRARMTHGQQGDTRGRVRRGSSSSVASLDDPSAQVEPMRMPAPLKLETGSSTRSTMRQALGGLDLDIGQVKREEKALNASFDFSAEGRLQTQGFEINTHGIASAPFASMQSAMGTREYLVILNELGHGASGKVYKALYIPTFKLVAVKVIRVFDQKKRHQMVRELRSLYANFVSIADPTSKAACEELVIFYDAYTNPETGSVSIVLEYMDGGSLEDCMQAAEGLVSEAEIANLAFWVLKGLAFLHESHQLHRDIKLSNMLINRKGHVKISDFGISRDLESTLAKATTFTGTLLYMAPERISGGMYSYPSDIWSFGLAVMAYAIGKLPVPSKEGYWGVVHAVQEQPSPRLADYGDRFSPALCDFIDQCLQKNPVLRPSAAMLLEHAFIKENYVGPIPPQSGDTSSSSDPSAAARTEKSQVELKQVAAQVRVWCDQHAERLLSPTSAVFHRMPHDAKMAALAQQLRLPVASVSAEFEFLTSYEQ